METDSELTDALERIASRTMALKAIKILAAGHLTAEDASNLEVIGAN